MGVIQGSAADQKSAGFEKNLINHMTCSYHNIIMVVAYAVLAIGYQIAPYMGGGYMFIT